MTEKKKEKSKFQLEYEAALKEAKDKRHEEFKRQLHCAQTSTDDIIDDLFELKEKHERLEQRYKDAKEQNDALLDKDDFETLINIMAFGTKGCVVFVDEERRVMVNMNDFYYWACADCEYITRHDFDLLLECQQLGKKHGSDRWIDVFSMAKREAQPPQYPMWEGFAEEHRVMCREKFGEDWDLEFVVKEYLGNQPVDALTEYIASFDEKKKNIAGQDAMAIILDAPETPKNRISATFAQLQDGLKHAKWLAKRTKEKADAESN